MGAQMLMDLINSLQVVEQGTMRKRGTGLRPPIEFSNKLFLISEKREVYLELKRTALFNPVVGQLNDRPIIQRESFTEALTIEIFPAFWKLLLTDLDKISFFEAKKILINYFSQSLPQHVTHICVNVSNNEAIVLRDIEYRNKLLPLYRQEDVRELFLPCPRRNLEEYLFNDGEQTQDEYVAWILRLSNEPFVSFKPLRNGITITFIGKKDALLSRVDRNKNYIFITPNFSELFIRQDDAITFNNYISVCEIESFLSQIEIRGSRYSHLLMVGIYLHYHLRNAQYPINIQ